MVNKKFSIFIYFLCSVLVLVLSIFIYRIITHIRYDDLAHKITISKYTGERISNITSGSLAKIATFPNADSGPSITGLSNADIIFEFLSNTSGITYKAIFNEDESKNVSSTIKLNNYSNLFTPTFNFSKNINSNETKNNAATSIFINFNETSSSNFLYQDGEYSHYRGLGIDDDNNIPVNISNVIIQFTHGDITNDENLTTPENSGAGLLFCNGTTQSIKWNREKDAQMKVSNLTGGSISLMPGPTWWVFVDSNSSVAYD